MSNCFQSIQKDLWNLRLWRWEVSALLLVLYTAPDSQLIIGKQIDLFALLTSSINFILSNITNHIYTILEEWSKTRWPTIITVSYVHKKTKKSNYTNSDTLISSDKKQPGHQHKIILVFCTKSCVYDYLNMLNVVILLHTELMTLSYHKTVDITPMSMAWS